MDKIDVFEKILKNESLNFGIKISDDKMRKFKIYFSFLLDYNSHTNLTSIIDPENVAIKHFLDSLILSKTIKIVDGDAAIDVGSGAGFPGIVFKILVPKIKLTVIDSCNKKVKFLNELVSKIDEPCEIIHNRAEDLAKKDGYRDNYDYVFSRAVAPLNILMEYCLPFLKVNGNFIAMKGLNAEEEIKNAENSINILGGMIKKIEKFFLPNENATRNLLVITKKKPTPDKYPRNSARIIKRPL